MIPLKDDIPTRRFPILTVILIVLNVAVYFGVEQGGLNLGQKGEDRVIEYGAIPYELAHPGKHCEVAGAGIACEGQRGVTGQAGKQAPTGLTVLTSMFLHGGLLHLAGNMLFLWVFGNNIEDSMGRPRFIAFYLLGGAAALAAQVAIDPGSTAPTVGASGAIAAVLGGYARLYPRARVVTLIFIVIFATIITVPALLVLGLWFLLQIAYGASSLGLPLGGSGGVAYFAHIGGFAFGLALITLFANRRQDDYEHERRIPMY